MSAVVVLNNTLTALLGSYLQAGMGSCALANRLFYEPKGWERLGDDDAVDAPSFWNGSWVLTPDGESANEEAGDGSFMERASHLPVEGCEEQCDAFRSQGFPCRAVYTLDPAYGGPDGAMVSRPECIYLSEKCVQNGRVPCLAEAWCGRNAPAEPDPMLCLFFGRDARGEVDPRSWHQGNPIFAEPVPEASNAPAHAVAAVASKATTVFFKEVPLRDFETLACFQEAVSARRALTDSPCP